MSSRAAWRLESLGFARVYCYGDGKLDWFACGLPRAGKLTGFPTTGDAMHRDVPTCHLEDGVAEVRARTRGAGWNMCVVVNERQVVLGVLRNDALDGDPALTAEQAMEPGPTTFRPNEPLAETAVQLVQAGVKRVLITTSDGELLGVLDRAEAVRRTGGAEPAT